MIEFVNPSNYSREKEKGKEKWKNSKGVVIVVLYYETRVVGAKEIEKEKETKVLVSKFFGFLGGCIASYLLQLNPTP